MQDPEYTVDKLPGITGISSACPLFSNGVWPDFLNDLVPDLQKMMDEGRIKFTPAVELAYIKPRNQNYFAVAIDSQQSSPSLSQAQRMRELDQKGVLNGDVIDGIMMEDKKESCK